MDSLLQPEHVLQSIRKDPSAQPREGVSDY